MFYNHGTSGVGKSKVNNIIDSLLQVVARASFRFWALSGVLLSVVVMAVVLFFQHGMGMEPCPLCVLQRICLISAGVVALLAMIHNPTAWGRRIYAVLAMIPTAAGIAIAGRHVWLQNLPEDQVPECGPGYDFIMEAFPFLDAMKIIFRGSGECAETDWQFLGLSMPGWALVIFAGMLLVQLYLLIRGPRIGLNR